MIRQKTFDELKKLLGDNKAKELESSIFSYSEDYAENNNTPFLLNDIYTSNSEKIIELVTKYLKTIIDGIGDNTIDIKKIPYMDEKDFNINLVKKKKEAEQKTVSSYKCDKCGKSKTTIELKQTRSPDEPETTKITCVECGNQWFLD